MQVFQSLTKGIRFNKERFQDEFNVFKVKPSLPSDADSKQPTPSHERSSLKRKKAPKEETDDDGDNDDNDDNASGAEAPANACEARQAGSVYSHLQSAQDAQAFRRLNEIKVTGHAVPWPATSFTELFHTHRFPATLPAAVRDAGYQVPTPVQLQAVPVLLGRRDVLACAPTGSGKTLGYLIPLIYHLGTPSCAGGVRAVVLAPTRELAEQIEREIRKLVSKRWKCVLFQHEAQCNKHTHCDVLISTPHRLSLVVKAQKIDLSKVKLVILDECDKLLETPGEENIQVILKACPQDKILGMFSATLPADIERFAKSMLKSDFVRVIVGHKNTVTTNIQQSLTFVGDECGKRATLRQQLATGALRPPVLVFVQDVRRARALHAALLADLLPVAYVHAERSAHARHDAVRDFRTGRACVLIATDLVARGMDLVVNTVVNFDFPTSTETYIHRIGRTGRAGRTGCAVTYFTVEDAKYLRCVVNIMKESGCEVPDWLLSLKAPSHEERKKLKYAPPKRKKFVQQPKPEAEGPEDKGEDIEN